MVLGMLISGRHYFHQTHDRRKRVNSTSFVARGFPHFALLHAGYTLIFA
jgi:hypothetical protein